jgi:hypothetical protein
MPRQAAAATRRPRRMQRLWRPRRMRRSSGENRQHGEPGTAGDFKLLRGVSDECSPSSPSQLILAIASIFSFSICKLKQFLKPARPYINVQVGSTPAAALYDSGAYICCISEVEFRKIPVEQHPDKQPGHHLDQCFSAGGGQLTVKGIFNLPVTILGKKITHPFRVINGLS